MTMEKRVRNEKSCAKWDEVLSEEDRKGNECSNESHP